MISVQCAGKTYETAGVCTVALHEVTLVIENGAYEAICGPSGSGKTTLLNLIGLLDTPSTGTVFLEGENTTVLSERRRSQLRNRTLGFVFQGFNLIPELKAWENVALPGRYGGMPLRDRKEKALAMINRVGLAHRAMSHPAQLSGGEEQRIAIARALLLSPAVVLADEPTGNLDSESSSTILDLFDSVHQHGSTLVTITHADEVASRASHITWLKDGSIVEAHGVS